MSFETDYTDSETALDLSNFDLTTNGLLLASKRIKWLNQIQLTNENNRLFLTSRYCQIPFPTFPIKLNSLKGIFSFFIYEGFDNKISGVTVYLSDVKDKFYLLSDFYFAEINVSNSLKDHPNFFINKYDFFIRINFSFFNKTLFLKASNANNNRVTSFLLANINSYISLKNQVFRVINIVFKPTHTTAYREYVSDYEEDGVTFGRALKVPKLIPYKEKVFECNKHRLYIVYDIETVPDLIEKKHYLYCLCATAFSYAAALVPLADEIDLSREFFETRKFVCNKISSVQDLTEDTLIDVQHLVASEFAKFIVSSVQAEYESILDCEGNPDYLLELHVVGFNNRNFDDHHIVQDLLREINYYRRVVHKRDLKVVSHEISSYNIVDGQSVTIFFDDVVIWLPEILSLKAACKEMDVTLAKLDFSAVEFNNLCLKRGEAVSKCDLITFLTLWSGDLSRIEGQITRAKRNNRFAGLNAAFLEIFKFPIEFTSFEQLIDLEPFVTNYCWFDVLATAELFLKLNESFSSCIREIYEENNLVDLVTSKKIVVNLVENVGEDTLKRKSVELKAFTTEFMSMAAYLTPSQASYTVFKFMFKDNLRVNNKFNPGLASVIEDAFFGGLVLLGGIGPFKGFIKQVDVRSEYPLAASGCLPILNEEYSYCQKLNYAHIKLLNAKIEKATKIRNEHFFAKDLHRQESISAIYECIDFLGIFRCRVKPPSSAEYMTMISPLILANKGPSGARKIDTFNIPYTKFFATPHIKNFILFGWSVEILHCDENVQFLWNTLFSVFDTCYQQKFCYLRKFISFFNEKKANSPNKVMKKFFKALMNLLCGRLAMRADCLTTTLTESNSASGYKTETKRIKPFDYNKSDKWLAVFINTNAHNIILSKIYLLELKQIYERVPVDLREPVLIYCDTDSMYFDTKNVLDELEFELSLELGDFDLTIFDYRVTWTSKLSGDEESTIYVLFKKGYIVLDSSDKIKDFKTKGVPQKDIQSIFYTSDNKLNIESLDTLFSSSISIPINKLTNKQDRNSLKKTFYNISIVKSLKIQQLNTSILDFSWKPAIPFGSVLKLTHSPCNRCSTCASWFKVIEKHQIYNL
jgi:hypothetical protein